MRKTLLALAGATLIAIPAVQADDDANRPMMGPEPADMAARMQENLGLTDAQRKQVQDVMTRHREKMKAAHEEMVTGVEKVLTPEQRTKWADMREKRAERMEKVMDKRQEKMEKRKERMEDRKGPPAAAPAP